MAQGRKYSAALSRILRSEYEAGATLKELAEKYHSDRATVSRVIVREGGTMRARGAKKDMPLQPTAVPREEWPRILERYNNGETLRELGASYQTSFHNIRHYILRSGGTMRKGGGKGKPRPHKCQRERTQGLLDWVRS